MDACKQCFSALTRSPTAPPPGVQGEAIAFNLREMFGLRVPIISVVIGEGGSGGALAIGCANKNLIMENSVYYVASPEACAAILWKSRAAAGQVRRAGGRCAGVHYCTCSLRLAGKGGRQWRLRDGSVQRIAQCNACEGRQGQELGLSG